MISNPNFGGGVSVHDPAVFYDESSSVFYVFGSHFAVASSPDLMHWTQIARDGEAHKLYGRKDFRSVLSESDRLAGGNQNTWAPDVIKHGNKYYMYYALTSAFGSNKSVIGRVEADSVLGPYSGEKIIVASGGYDGEPNCIDPNLYYDKDGGLWMVYGSFFAGIYVKELHNGGESFGLPKEEGFGKLVWKGNMAQGPEGPFVFYHAETDYYYLMVSYGDLSKSYNMRAARSRNPDGPFVDITGADMAATLYGGNKLAGNFQFKGDPTGYAAMGHNSVLEKDGKFYCVYHTRYRKGVAGVTGWHNVRISQIFFNEEGWPVLSLACYAGETLGTVTAADVADSYDIVVHTAGSDVTFAESSVHTLTADGKITVGASKAGSWALKEGKYITLTLNGTIYRGVVAPAWNSYRGHGMLAITATSDMGGALWAHGGALIPD